MSFGTILKIERVKKNKTQKEVADETGISQAIYSKYENNVGNPTLKNARKLADYYGLKLDEVFTD